MEACCSGRELRAEWRFVGGEGLGVQLGGRFQRYVDRFAVLDGFGRRRLMTLKGDETRDTISFHTEMEGRLKMEW